MYKIELDEVLKAYANTKLTPCIVRSYNKDYHAGCALGALYISQFGTVELILKVGTATHSPIAQWAENKYGSEFARGFMLGFDLFLEQTRVLEDGEYKNGYENGKYIRQEMARLGIVVEEKIY